MKLVELRNLLVWTRMQKTNFFDKLYFTTFYLTSFICLCGRTKLPVFPLSIGELSLNKRASGNRKRKSQTNTTTPGSPQSAAQFQTEFSWLDC